MDTAAWILEYGKVLLCYACLMFVWPKLMFRRHLSGRSRVYQFGFCAAGQVVLVATVVLGLGVLHLLNQWTVWLFFYGIPLGRGIHYAYTHRESLARMFHQAATHGKKTLSGRGARLVRRGLVRLGRMLRRDFWECLAVVAVAVYAMIYFSWGTFQCPSYGFGDLYTHHSWINGLIKGKAFSAGVYPEGMHCIVYALHTLFGVDVYSILLFLGGIQIALTVVAAWLLLRELFGWRYTGIFALILFLTLNVSSVNGMSAMSRLQYVLPQEFGMPAQLLCPLFLVRYLKSAECRVQTGGWAKYCINEELFAFLLALAATIVIHFYSTIMAFFLCVAVALFYFRQIFTRKRLAPLLASVACALAVAVGPMLIALASGTPFQESINWALRVIEGTDASTNIPVDQSSDAAVEEEVGVLAAISNRWERFYNKAYKELYGRQRAQALFCLTGFALGLGVLALVLLRLCPARWRERLAKAGFTGDTAKGYMAMALASVIFLVLYAARVLGLPSLVSDVRLLATEQLLILAAACVPLDIVFVLLASFCPQGLLHVLSYGCGAGVCAWVILSGNYHGYLYMEYNRYNAEVAVTESIKDSFDNHSYTLVSPTEVLYAVETTGWHEELLRFVEGGASAHYTLPSEYVFVYVEKRPMVHSQIHFFTGPAWLAETRYYPEMDAVTTIDISQEPEVVGWEVSEEFARQDLANLPVPFKAYTFVENRTAIESRAWLWCEEFARLYPSEMNIYYEDEDFICYCFRQEGHAPYELGFGDEG